MADSPVSYWRLGETGGTVAADSADGNTGTITGGVTLGIPGALPNDTNTAMTFNGTDGYISGLDTANLDILGNLTVEAWANPSVLNNTSGAVFNKGVYQYRLGINNNAWRGSVFFRGVAYDVSSPTLTVPGTWDYLVLTRNSTTLTLYVNSVSVATLTIPSGNIATSTGIFAIGRKSSTVTNFFNGSIDEIAVYNKALTPDRILAHYTAGRPAAPANRQVAPTFQP